MKKRSIFSRRTLALLLALALILTSGISGFASDRVTHDDYVVEENYFDDILITIDDIDEALQEVLEELEEEGMVGFEGRFALPEDEDEIVSVFALFDSAPAAIQILDAERRDGRSLDAEAAREVVESEHEAFWDELLASDIPFGNYLEYKLALNAVQLELPAGRVRDLAAFDSVRAIYPFVEQHRELPEFEPVIEARRDPETRDPIGNAAGRALMRANEMHAKGFTGEGIVIAVVDGGVDPRHPALRGTFLTFEEQQARMHPDWAHVLTDANNIGGNFYGRWFNGNVVSPEPRATNNHGTHVTGTVLGRDSGTDRAVLGVAPGARSFHYRVGNFAAAAEWVLRDGPDMATMSWGDGGNNTPARLSTVANNIVGLTDPMFVWVNAMNNTGHFYYTGDSPDNSPMVLATAAAEILNFHNDALPTLVGTVNFSGRGPVAVSHAIRPDITAHGVNVVSSNAMGAVAGPLTPGVPTADLIAAIPDTLTPVQLEPLGTSSGTSMATPHVAGAVALLMEYDIYLNGERTWTAAEIKSRLMHNAWQFYTPHQTAFSTGGGFVDVVAAVEAETAVTVNYDRVVTRALHTPANVGSVANYNTHANHYWSHLTNNDFGIGRVASFSFGGSNQRVADPMSRQLIGFVRNFDNVARQYTITTEFRHNAGDAATVSFNTPVMTVPAGAEIPFIASFNIDPELAERGFYEGRVVVTRTPIGGEEPEVLRVPFAFTYQPPTAMTNSGNSGVVGAGTPAGAQPRPPLPIKMEITEVGRPVISTNVDTRVNRASGLLAMEFDHWQTFTSTMRITNAESGANTVANLGQFNMAFIPAVPFEQLPASAPNRLAPLDRSAQAALNIAEGSYILNFLTGHTAQTAPNNLAVLRWIPTPFFVDNTPPELEFEIEREPGATVATITGTVYDEWATWAAENDVTFPGNAKHGLPTEVDQSFNAVWISVDGAPSFRAEVDAEGAFEAELTGLPLNRMTEITVWAIDNYTLIPEVEVFRATSTNTTLNFGAAARDYFLPGGLMDGFVRGPEGYVWSGLNMTENSVLVSPGGGVIDEWVDPTEIRFTLPATIRRNQPVTPVLFIDPADAYQGARWTSSNPSLAHVDPFSGVVTARVASGTVVITATTLCGTLRHSVTVRLSA